MDVKDMLLMRPEKVAKGILAVGEAMKRAGLKTVKIDGLVFEAAGSSPPDVTAVDSEEARLIASMQKDAESAPDGDPLNDPMTGRNAAGDFHQFTPPPGIDGDADGA